MSDLAVRRFATGVIVACAAALAVTGAALTSPSVQAWLGWAAERAPGYTAGETIDVAPHLYSSTRRTVFIFARSSCPACQRAKPQMAALVSELAQREDTRVVMLHPRDGSPEDDRHLADELGLADTDRVPITPEALRVQRVPTIVVVDESGTILLAHEGVPTEADRRHVVQVATARG